MRDIADLSVIGPWLRRQPALLDWITAVEKAVQHQRQLCHLRRLDDRLLRDIGVSRKEAMLGFPLVGNALSGRAVRP